jgi:hypothetical protein
MEKQVVYEFARNKDERVCVSVGSYRENVYIDFRIFFIDRSTGELRPTKKGITVLQSLLPQLKNALIACEKAQFQMKQ